MELELFNNSIEYDDAAVCLLEGIYRIGNEETSTSHFIIQPNPANNNITISMLESDAGIQSFEISDVLGKLLVTKKLNSTYRTEQLNTNELANGLYLITVVSTFGKSSTQKLIIQH